MCGRARGVQCTRFEVLEQYASGCRHSPLQFLALTSASSVLQGRSRTLGPLRGVPSWKGAAAGGAGDLLRGPTPPLRRSSAETCAGDLQSRILLSTGSGSAGQVKAKQPFGTHFERRGDVCPLGYVLDGKSSETAQDAGSCFCLACKWSWVERLWIASSLPQEHRAIRSVRTRANGGLLNGARRWARTVLRFGPSGKVGCPLQARRGKQFALRTCMTLFKTRLDLEQGMFNIKSADPLSSIQSIVRVSRFHALWRYRTFDEVTSRHCL